MTATLSKVDLFRHIRSMAYVSVPAFIIAAIAYWITGAVLSEGNGDLTIAKDTMAGLQESFEISWIMLIPALVVVIMLLFKLPSVPVILFGIDWKFLGSDIPRVWFHRSNTNIVFRKYTVDGNCIYRQLT